MRHVSQPVSSSVRDIDRHPGGTFLTRLFCMSRLFALLVLNFHLASCATNAGAFRALAPEAEACQVYAGNQYPTNLQVQLKKQPKLNEGQSLGRAAACYEQRHALSLSESTDTIKYQLNFLEFKGNGELKKPEQWDAIVNALRRPDISKYVILFVHGWRHDARLNDSNVHAFRTMLAYSAKHLHDRRQAYGSDAQVFGIYIGWPGNAWQWKWIDDLYLPSLVTFWSAKKRSEYLAPYVRSRIHAIREIIHPVERAENLNRFLIVGHSFGGNLLINALKQDYIGIIPDDGRPYSGLINGISDLTVLLNPASEFLHWKELQEAAFKRSGYQKFPYFKSFEHADNKFFDPRQKPLLMSITSTCDWDKAKIPFDNCDRPTAWAFPIGQIAALRTHHDRRHAMGHVRAYVGDAKTPNQDYGITHELEDFTTEKDPAEVVIPFPTSYTNAADGRNACPPANYWLGKAQQKQVNAKEFGRAWDTVGDIPSIEGANIQIRHGSLRRKSTYEPNKFYRPVGPAYQPFWNVASHSSIVPDHNTVFSKQLFCLFSQIVLDPLTGKPNDSTETALSR